MTNEEEEAYLRKHTLIGQWGEAHEAGAILVQLIVRDCSAFLLKLLDMLGI